jgi:hypothetical protein
MDCVKFDGIKATKFKLMKDHGNKENLVIKKLTP